MIGRLAWTQKGELRVRPALLRARAAIWPSVTFPALPPSCCVLRCWPQMSLFYAPAFFAHLLGWALQHKGLIAKVGHAVP